MLTALVLTALVHVQETPTFREIERLKFEALHALDNGKFTWQGTMKSGSEPSVLMKVDVKIKGEKIWTQVTANGDRQAILMNSDEVSMFVSFVDNAYGIFPLEEKQPLRAEKKFEVPKFEDGFDFNIDSNGPSVALGTSTEETFIDKGTEVVDGEELEWYEHFIRTNKGRAQIKQWFRKGTWLVKKFTIQGDSESRGAMNIDVVTTVLDTDTVVTDEELEIAPSLYAGMRKARNPGPDKRWEREPRTDLPEAPGFDEIENLKIGAMGKLASGKFHVVFTMSGDMGASVMETKTVFRGDDERVTAWTDGDKLLEQKAGTGVWLSVMPNLLAYSIDKPKGGQLRSERSAASLNQTGLFTYDSAGVHIFTGEIDEDVYLDYGEETVDEIECVWYEHRVTSSSFVANVKQWFKKGTWLTYRTDIEAIHPTNGELAVIVRMKQFEPDATVTDVDLLIDPALYMGYRLTSTENPTGLGREAIESDAPDYHEIDRLKFQELLALDSGKFEYVNEMRVMGEIPMISEMEYVFRGDSYHFYSSEGGERVNDSAVLNGTSFNVFHKLRSYFARPQDSAWRRQDQKFTKPEVSIRKIRFSSYWTGVYVYMHEKDFPKLVASGEETVDGTQCQWYEHELSNEDGGFIVRQWFQKGTWLLVKLEARVIDGLVMTGAISSRAKVFAPNATVTDADLAVDPERYKGYTKLDPPQLR